MSDLIFEDGFIKKQGRHPGALIADIDMHGTPLDPRTPSLKDVIPLIKDLEKHELDKRTQLATKNVRDVIPRFKTILPTNRLYQGKPRYPLKAVAFLKSPQSDLSKFNACSFASPRYIRACMNVCNDLDKINSQGLNRSDYLMLLTDYGIWPLLSNQIRTDGRWKNPEIRNQKEKLAQYRQFFARYMIDKILKISDEDLMRLKPKMHVSKSVGFYTMYPDGRPFNASNAVYDLYKQDAVKDKSMITHSAVARKFTGQNKQEWLISGALLRNFDFALQYGCDILLDKGVLAKGISMGAVSIHTEAFRNNEYDEFIDLPIGITKDVLVKAYDKNRVVSFFSNDGSVVYSGELQNDKMCALLHERLPDHVLKKGKHRSMFPGSMNSIEPAYIYAYRLFNLPLEAQPNGFLSLEENSLKSFEDALSRSTTYKGVVALQWDGSNSEQIISDNADIMESLYPKAFSRIFHASNTAILSDATGPRGAIDVTPSGGAQTSSNNMHFHEFYKLEILERIISPKKDWARLRESFLQQMFGGGESFVDVSTFSDKVSAVISKKGLDDQFVIFCSSELTSKQLSVLIKEKIDDFMTLFHYKYDVYDRDSDNNVFKFFGLFVNLLEGSVEYRTSNSIGSLTRLEHVASGHVAALHIYRKWNSLHPDVQKIFDLAFAKEGLIRSTFAEYESPAMAALREIKAFGFSVAELINEYQPSSRLLWGSELKPFDIVNDSEAYQYDDEKMLEIGHRIQQELTSNGIYNEIA